MNAPYSDVKPSDDLTSYPLELSNYNTHGLCQNYRLRRHKFESESNAGTQEARQDWIEYIGPVDKFGNSNPIDGNFTAVVLPLLLPERIRTVAYILEYAFLYDNVVETICPSNGEDDEPTWDDTKHCKNPALGKKQIEAKMMLKLASTDPACTERVMRVWKEMLSTTVRDQKKKFSSLEEYVDFRIIDTGAPFVEAMMLWGMGMQLSPEEDQQLEPVIKPCYAALGLANDYFSFDREYAEFQESSSSSSSSSGSHLTNSVWLHMQWHGVDVQSAKEMVLKATSSYEQDFLRRVDEFKRTTTTTTHHLDPKLDRYLRALSYQVAGNVVWSLNCPRYHPDYRYDANAGLENLLTAKHFGNVEHHHQHQMPDNYASDKSASSDSLTSSDSDDSGYDDDDDDAATTASSVTSSHHPCPGRKQSESSFEVPKEERLSAKLVDTPFEYITSLPSKGVRDTFIDALNIWLDVPEQTVTKIKQVSNKLHSASLMLDDIEDNSELRRSKPATHTVYGVAQTINSANYAIVKAAKEAGEICPDGANIVLGDLLDLHIGQSYDLFWTRHGHCPSEDEYIEMVAKKTGGLFRMITRLMLNSSTTSTSSSSSQTNIRVGDNIEKFVQLVGIHFQIRDDYQNLSSAEYSSQKGFCEDLDEGKISFPLIHLLNNHNNNDIVREIFQQRRDRGCLSRPHKDIVLERMRDGGSLEYTRQTLKRLETQIELDVGKLEGEMGRENWLFRLLIHKLRI
ncbi:isoprenoid synthase domain-containing protein [Poronia punctata]|nr:isoprenoid synthase domain-containing protein [Poronia punctata]